MSMDAQLLSKQEFKEILCNDKELQDLLSKSGSLDEIYTYIYHVGQLFSDKSPIDAWVVWNTLCKIFTDMYGISILDLCYDGIMVSTCLTHIYDEHIEFPSCINYFNVSGISVNTDVKVVDLSKCSDVKFERYAVYNCIGLRKLILPKSFRCDSQLIANCPNLKSLQYPGTVEELATLCKFTNKIVATKKKRHIPHIECTDGNYEL